VADCTPDRTSESWPAGRVRRRWTLAPSSPGFARRHPLASRDLVCRCAFPASPAGPASTAAAPPPMGGLRPARQGVSRSHGGPGPHLRARLQPCSVRGRYPPASTLLSPLVEDDHGPRSPAWWPRKPPCCSCCAPAPVTVQRGEGQPPRSAIRFADFQTVDFHNLDADLSVPAAGRARPHYRATRNIKARAFQSRGGRTAPRPRGVAPGGARQRLL